MPNIEFQMSAEEGEALKAMLNVVRAQKEIENQTKLNNRASQDWWQASKEGIDKANSALSVHEKSIKGLQGVLGAALAGMKAFAEFSEERLKIMTEKANAYRESISQLDKALSATGDIAMLPEIEASLNTIKSREMNQGQIRDLYNFASQEGGGEFSPQQLLEAVKEGVAAAAAGKDSRAFTSTFLALKDAGFADDESGSVSDKVTELMDAFQGGLGDGEKKFLGQLESSGIDKNQALRMLLASKQSDQGSKVLQQIMNVANADISDSQLKPERRKTAEQEAELENIKARQLEIDKRKLEIDEQIAQKPWQKRVLSKESDALSLEERKMSLRQQEIEAAAPLSLSPEQERMKRLASLPKGGARIAEILKNPDLLGDEKAAFGAVMGSLDEEAFSQGGAFGYDIQQRQKTINSNTRLKLLSDRKAQQIDLENRKLNPTLKELIIEQNNARREAEDQRIIEQGGVEGFLMSVIKSTGLDKVNRSMEAGGDMNNDAAVLNGQNQGYTAQSDTIKYLKSIDEKTRNAPTVSRPPGGAERSAVEGN